MPSLDIVDFVLKWCYQNLSELVLVKQEDLFTYPAVNDLQQDFVNRFLDKNAFDSMIAGNKEDSVKKVTEINAFVAHCLRIVKEQVLSGSESTAGHGEIVVKIDDLMSDCFEINMDELHIPLKRCDKIDKLFSTDEHDDDEVVYHDAMSPQEAHQVKFKEVLGAANVSLSPFQPRY